MHLHRLLASVREQEIRVKQQTEIRNPKYGDRASSGKSYTVTIQEKIVTDYAFIVCNVYIYVTYIICKDICIMYVTDSFSSTFQVLFHFFFTQLGCTPTAEPYPSLILA